MRRTPGLVLLALSLVTAGPTAHAGEIGHFNAGIMGIRDYFMPKPGVYGALFNYYYTTDRLNDGHGDQVSSVTIAPPVGPPVGVNVDVNLDLFVVAPMVIWVSDWKLLGVRYGALVSFPLANSSFSASLSTATGRGGTIEASSFAVADLFVQPVWLGWKLSHWDVGLAYGFYAPTGKYETETVTLPGGASVVTESDENIGYGYWTHQFQGGVAWYPWTHKGTAVTAALTYEINGRKDGFDLTPGQVFTVNWGVSQFLPLDQDEHLLLEIGPAGYSTWQTGDDTGADAHRVDEYDRVNSAGGQLGLTCVPWGAALNLHAFFEFDARYRMQGQAFGINLAKMF